VNAERLSDLRALALSVREHILRMATDGGCFAGASLSCADLLVFLYGQFLRVHPDRLADPDRDYLLLSKGHDVPALYATCAELGFFEVARLKHHLRPEDHLYWHPNRLVPGVEFHSGSLGHLLAVGLGVAYDIRLRGGSNRVVVVVGDGELNEGSVWESLLVAQAHSLGNLVVVVDRNGIQANARTEELIPLEPLAQKFEAFGCAVRSVDGHDFEALEHVFARVPFDPVAPSVIIARTVRGRGVPSLEDRVDRWFCNFTGAEVEALVAELHGEADAGAVLASEPLMVR
jgi:transketolase